jgi:RecT family
VSTESGLAIQTMEQAQQLAKTLSPSALLPDSLRGKPGDVLIVLLTGAELGLGPMQSLRGISVIKGKATMSADLMLALVKKSEACEYIVMSEYTAERVTFKTKRKGDPQETVVSFSKADAVTAGLWGNNTWKAYPQAMLKARAASSLCRAVYPDVVLGIYDETEAVADFKVPPPAGAAFEHPPATVVMEQPQIDTAPEYTQEPPPHDAVTGEVHEPSIDDTTEDVMAHVFAKRLRDAKGNARQTVLIMKDIPEHLRAKVAELSREVR